MRRSVQIWKAPAAAILFCITAWCQRAKQERWSEANGVLFKVPDGYQERKSRDSRVIIVEYSGMTSSSLIKVYFEHRPIGIPGQELTPEKMKLLGLSKIGERKLTMTGRDGACAEYSVKTRSAVEIRQAECSFGTELHTSFFGSPERLAEFYEFMQAAEPVRKEPA